MTTKTEVRLDDFTIGAFKDQLLDMEPGSLEQEYERLYWANGDLIPVETKEAPWIQDVGYRETTVLGSWEIMRDYTTHIPMVERLSREFRQSVIKIGGGYRYTDDEMTQAIHLNEPIEQQKMNAVIAAGKQKLDDLMFRGGEGVQGFLNHPSTLRMFAAFPFNASSTANQILATLIDSENTISRITKDIEQPDTLLMAKSAWDYTSYARLDSSVSDTSILEYYMKRSPYIQDIQPLLPLEGVGENGSNVACMYKRDINKLKARITQSMGFRKFLPTAWGMERTCTMRYGGLVIYRPYSILWINGI